MSLALLFAHVALVPPGAPVLGLPIDCEIGKECLVQQYVDHDPGPGTADYRCGGQSYDGHTGTDIRVRNLEVMKAGVPVLAAAPGRVYAIRDGEPDMFRKDRPAEALEGRGCGNGIVVTHGEGWQTQYCHLKRGSVSVGPGDAVTRGQRIAEVGLSGNTDFPHLEFVVRHKGEALDPFAPEPGLKCEGGEAALWSDEARAVLAYQDTTLLNAGFATDRVTNRAIEDGAGEGFALSAQSPALVLFGRMVNVRTGDRLRLVIEGPRGFKVESEADPAPNHQAQRMAFAGQKRPSGGWPAGEYRGRVEILRDGEVVDRQELSLTYPPRP